MNIQITTELVYLTSCLRDDLAKGKKLQTAANDLYDVALLSNRKRTTKEAKNLVGNAIIYLGYPLDSINFA